MRRDLAKIRRKTFTALSDHPPLESNPLLVRCCGSLMNLSCFLNLFARSYLVAEAPVLPQVALLPDVWTDVTQMSMSLSVSPVDRKRMSDSIDEGSRSLDKKALWIRELFG